jgi:predicted transcriptional regulator
MPDLKSQLAEVKHKLATMAFDDGGEATETIEPTPPMANQSRTLWLAIKDHPSSTAAEAAQWAGIDRSSASTLTSQMFTKGILTRTKAGEDGAYRYTVADPDYKPMSKHQAIERAVAAKLAIKSKKAKKAKAAVAAPTPAAPPDITVHDLLNTMSITKARALYDELKKIFGG